MADADPEQLTPGTVLSHFVLDEFIGGGAMGQVWRGSDRRDSSHVAVKIMNPGFGRDPMFRQRFEREAHLATLLKSPYTVQTLAFGRERGHYFIVMEFVEGDSIESLLERGPIPLDEALEIGSDVARALEAAATQKIVHRDLKPSNVILSPDGAAKLVDFGIASQTASRDSAGGFVGTVQYAAPEQQKGDADGRTDIYALGATLFHMLAGRPPYTGRTNSDILAQHAHSPFPAALLALQPEPVVDIVRRCMQKDPDDRYQSASELANALDRVRSRLAQQKLDAPPDVPGPGRTLVPEAEDPHERLGTAAAAAGGATLHLGPKPAGATAGPMDELSGGTVVFPSAAAPGTGTATGAPAALSPTVPPSAVPTAVGAGLGATVPPPPVAPPLPGTSVPPPSRPGEAAAVAAPMPYPGERREEKKSRKGLLLAILGAVVLVGAIGGVAVALVGGGGGGGSNQGGVDASATARASASASSGAGGGSVTASPSASPSPSESATETPTEAPTEAPTDTPTPTEVPATATPVRPTQPPTQPPPTQPPAQPQLFFGGASCNGGEVNASASFQNMPAGTQFQGVLDGAFTATSFGGGSGSVGFNWGGVPPGPHTITVSAAGKSAGGAVQC